MPKITVEVDLKDLTTEDMVKELERRGAALYDGTREGWIALKFHLKHMPEYIIVKNTHGKHIPNQYEEQYKDQSPTFFVGEEPYMFKHAPVGCPCHVCKDEAKEKGWL